MVTRLAPKPRSVARFIAGRGTVTLSLWSTVSSILAGAGGSHVSAAELVAGCRVCRRFRSGLHFFARLKRPHSRKRPEMPPQLPRLRRQPPAPPRRHLPRQHPQARSLPPMLSASLLRRRSIQFPRAPKFCLSCAALSTPKAPRPATVSDSSSTFPVVVGNRVMIPTGVYVQGMVDRVQRGGRVKGKAQLDMHFTSMIFPNGTVVEIPGVVDSMPVAKSRR